MQTKPFPAKSILVQEIDIDRYRYKFIYKI